MSDNQDNELNDARPVADVPAADAPAGLDADTSPASAAPATSTRNALGIWAVVTGALLLFPIALVLGHLGLRASRQGEATNRRVALAGVVLGYVGMAVALVGTALALFVSGPNVAAQNTDIAAKTDAINIGNAMVLVSTQSGQVPTVELMGSSYTVGDEVVERELDTDVTVTTEGSSATDWCVNLSYEGGNSTDVSFSATAGLVEGAHCGL